MQNRFLIILIGILANSLVWAVDVSLPSALTYLAKPIDPLCFFESEGALANIDLSHCGVSKDKSLVKTPNKALIKKGFVGFDWKNPHTAYPSGGSSYYKVYPAGANQWWIYTLNNSGGSGDFTSLGRVARKDTKTLQFRPIAQGDRCNGGIFSVYEKSHHLFFATHITAHDLVSLTKPHQSALKPYDDLAACATCCAAQALYEVDDSLKPVLRFVSFDSSAANAAEMPDQGRYQACFNTLVASYVAKHKQQLNYSELKQFVSEFTSRCVHLLNSVKQTHF